MRLSPGTGESGGSPFIASPSARLRRSQPHYIAVLRAISRDLRTASAASGYCPRSRIVIDCAGDNNDP